MDEARVVSIVFSSSDHLVAEQAAATGSFFASFFRATFLALTIAFFFFMIACFTAFC